MTAKQTFSGLVAEKGIQATLVDCRDASELDSSVAGVLEEAAAPETSRPSCTSEYEAVAAGPPRLVARERRRLGFERRGGDR